jgi:hypothetical protein
MKAWTTSTFFDYSQKDDGGTFDLRVTRTCKICGYQTPERQTCGSFRIGQLEEENRAEEEMMIRHIMEYHINKIGEAEK